MGNGSRRMLMMFSALIVGCSFSAVPPGKGTLTLDFADVPTCEQRSEGVCLDFMATFELTGESARVEFIAGPGGTYETTLAPGAYQLNAVTDGRCVSPSEFSVQEGGSHRSSVVWPMDCSVESGHPPSAPTGPLPPATPPPAS